MGMPTQKAEAAEASEGLSLSRSATHSQLPSSPIDCFASPSPLALPQCSVAVRCQSQSSNSAKLRFVSSNAMAEDRVHARPAPASPKDVGEVYELEDEFDLQLLDECERLEAESLRTITRTRRQSAPTTSNVLGAQKRRTRQSSAGGSTIDLIDPQDESPDQNLPRKRAKGQKQDWVRVRDLLANSNGVRASSPSAADHVSEPHARLPLQLSTIAQQTGAPANGVTTHTPTIDRNAFQEEPIATASADSRSGSDEDVPLASASRAAPTSVCSVDKSAFVLAAIDKIGEALKELREAYKLEMQRFQAKLMEHEVLIDYVRIHVRGRCRRRE